MQIVRSLVACGQAPGMVTRGSAIRGILFFALNGSLCSPDFFFRHRRIFFFRPRRIFFPPRLEASSQAVSLAVRSAIRTDTVKNVFA